MHYVLIALIGIFGGIASGLFGVGGGSVFVPLLIIFLSVNPHVAIGTSLAVVIPTALIAVLVHNRAEMVDWKMALILTVFSVAAAFLASKLSLRLDPTLLKRLFAVYLLVVAVRIFFN